MRLARYSARTQHDQPRVPDVTSARNPANAGTRPSPNSPGQPDQPNAQVVNACDTSPGFRFRSYSPRTCTRPGQSVGDYAAFMIDSVVNRQAGWLSEG
jgi:hypothetical protein